MSIVIDKKDITNLTREQKIQALVFANAPLDIRDWQQPEVQKYYDLLSDDELTTKIEALNQVVLPSPPKKITPLEEKHRLIEARRLANKPKQNVAKCVEFKKPVRYTAAEELVYELIRCGCNATEVVPHKVVGVKLRNGIDKNKVMHKARRVGFSGEILYG